MIRFADDYVIVFTNERDARRVQEVLPKRFGKYGLTLHERRPGWWIFTVPEGADVSPETFVFLGFTHYWGKSRKGNWVVQRKTRKKKLKDGRAKGVSVVQRAPPRSGKGAVAGALPKDAWALRLLWDYI